MDPEYIEISTRQGKLKGAIKMSSGIKKKTYFSFQGIPYAKPPVGDLRFKAPVPYGSWEGVRDATKEGNDSVQNRMFLNTLTGDEDCLYLNVYISKPENKTIAATKLAVMVWIHGGAFSKGSGSTEIYGPDYLIEEDIVLVTFNYRCGVLGFLSLENEAVPGNAGLKDQNMALKWVQENIISFGGDPNNVTIFGESAGSASVHYHLLSPLSRGLFHKAILQSGFSLCLWALQPTPKKNALLLAQELGCTSQNIDEVLEFLKSVPAEELVKVLENQTLYTAKEIIQTFSTIFVPCVEVVNDYQFLPDYPRKIMERGEFSKVPIILGMNDKEGLMALSTKDINFDLLNNETSVLVPKDLGINGEIAEERELGKEILQFYTNNESVSWSTIQGFVDFMTDIIFTIGLQDTRLLLLNQMSMPVYSYMFTYNSPLAFSSLLLPVLCPDRASELVGCGASHADELVYQFKTNIKIPYVPHVSLSLEDQTFVSKFVKTWTTFAKTGNPSVEDLGIVWNADNTENPNFLEIGKVWRTVDGIPFQKRVEFWWKLYKKYSYLY